MSTGANDIANVLQFATFRDHESGHVAVYRRWLCILISELFQPSHNGGIPTFKELRLIFGCKTKAFTYDLHQSFNDFNFHVYLRRFAKGISGIALQFLNHRLAGSIFRKSID